MLAARFSVHLIMEIENKNILSFHFGIQNHINGLESLKDELNIITKAKNELEKRLQTTVIEKETIFTSLEEALDRIHTLERHSREQESKLMVTNGLIFPSWQIAQIKLHFQSKNSRFFFCLVHFTVNDTALGPGARGKQCTVWKISEYINQTPQSSILIY